MKVGEGTDEQKEKERQRQIIPTSESQSIWLPVQRIDEPCSRTGLR